MTPDKMQRQIARLEREIAHFKKLLEDAEEPATRAQKTVRGRRRNCLSRRQRQLTCLLAGDHLSNWSNY